VEKLECFGYPMAKKFGGCIRLLILTEYSYVTDGRQTDGQTPHDGIYAALMHSIAR